MLSLLSFFYANPSLINVHETKIQDDILLREIIQYILPYPNAKMEEIIGKTVLYSRLCT